MKMLTKLSCFAAVLLATTSMSAHAWDAARGKEISATCAACHGPDGTSAVPDFPNIGGQYKEYLYRALQDYKLGKREDPIMAGQVAELSKKDMQDLAAFYSAQTGLFMKR